MNKTGNSNPDISQQTENNTSNNENSGSSNNDGNSSNTSYATELILNSARQVTIAVGSSVKLKSDYISVSPASLLNYISTTISVRGSGVNNGITFNSDTIYANAVGNYSLKFSIPASSSSNLSETMLVNVVSTNSHVVQNVNTLTIDQPVVVDELFTTYATGYEISYSSQSFEISNNTITAKVLGNQIIEVVFSKDYFSYCYEFSFLVRDIPNYNILITNFDSDAITKNLSLNSFSIYYEITNREEEHVDQDIIVEIEDDSIIYVNEADIQNPRIKVHCLSVGTTTLKISLAVDPSVSKIITITIE